jgi:predicted RecB family endonuclease
MAFHLTMAHLDLVMVRQVQEVAEDLVDLMGRLDVEVMVEQEVHMVVAEELLYIFNVKDLKAQVAQEALALFVLSGPVALVHSHQLA